MDVFALKRGFSAIASRAFGARLVHHHCVRQFRLLIPNPLSKRFLGFYSVRIQPSDVNLFIPLTQSEKDIKRISEKFKLVSKGNRSFKLEYDGYSSENCNRNIIKE